MKFTNLLIIAVTCGAMARAQDQPSPGDIIIKPLVHEMKYCLGPTSYFPQKQQPDPSDITLRLSLRLLYENRLPGPIILPLRFRSVQRMVVSGERDREIIKTQKDPLDAEDLKRLTQPNQRLWASEAVPPFFVVIPGGQSEAAYLGELVDVPVRTSGRRLLGRTIRVSITRHHDLISPSIVTELQNKWKAYGVLWTGTQDSDAVVVSIPESPVTVVCRDDVF